MKKILYRQCGFNILTISNVINLIVGFILSIYLTKNMGISSYGEFSVYQGYAQIGVAFFNLKLWEPLICDLKDEHEVSNKIKTCYITELVFSIAGLLFTLCIFELCNLFELFNDVNRTAIFYCLLMIPFLCINTQNTLIRLRGHYVITLISNTLSGLIKLSTVFLYDDIQMICISYTISELIRYMILSLVFMSDEFKCEFFSARFDSIYFKSIWNRSFHLNLSSIIDIPVNYLDRIVISHLLNMESAGIYSFGKRIALLFTVFTNSYHQHSYKNKISGLGISPLSILHRIRKEIIISILLIMVSTLFGYEFINIIGSDVLNVNHLMLIFIICFASALSFSLIYIQPLFISLGGYKNNTYYTMIANSLFIISLFVMVNSFGLIGAAVCMVGQAIILFILKYGYIKGKCEH